MLNKEQVKEVMDKYKLECCPEFRNTDLTVTCLGNWEGFGFAIWYETDTFEYRRNGNWHSSFSANSFLDFSDDYLEAMGVSTNWYHRWLPVIDELMELSGMKIEPTVPEQINAILKAHKVEQSDNEYEKTCITEDGFARIYASELVIVIQPEEELMHISTPRAVYTRTESFSVWENYDAETFPSRHLDISYDWWFKHLCDALFEIIELLESPDTSSRSDVKSLDDMVMEILKYVHEEAPVKNIRITRGTVYFMAGHFEYWANKNDVQVRAHIDCSDQSKGEVRTRQYDYFTEDGTIAFQGAFQKLREFISTYLPQESCADPPPITCEDATENETVIQLRKQVEELQEKNEELERQLKDLDEVFETVRTSKNRTIKNELTERSHQ